jgi:hypothetical protein
MCATSRRRSAIHHEPTYAAGTKCQISCTEPGDQARRKTQLLKGETEEADLVWNRAGLQFHSYGWGTK